MRDDVFRPVTASLSDLVGKEFTDSVCRARSVLTGESLGESRQLAGTPVDFFPSRFRERLRSLLPAVGRRLVTSTCTTSPGASTQTFASAEHRDAAPLSGFGYYRIGEDGRLYVISKSEHYHAPLGHGFPGYRLLDTASRLGLPNATHNNTRGAITRLLERSLTEAAGGGLDRVLNLQTGSLACEAALKLLLARFHRFDPGSPAPEHAGLTPVFLVVGDDDGRALGNYHGTTIFAQTLRGLWPDFLRGCEEAGLYRVAAVRPNRTEDLAAAFAEWNRPPFRIAGFIHEIVMMNYGARLLNPDFLQEAYRLCSAHDVPTVADEIQSCMWYDGFFLYRHFGLEPDFVVLGKGFPGGEYAASRLLFRGRFDCLPQFGALVTNGQEELSSLAYLITMRWASANGDAVRYLGAAIEERFRSLARDYPAILSGYEGKGHLSGLAFRSPESARAFATVLNRNGFDISVQTYKADCPPVALTKLPLIAEEDVLDLLVGRMREALRRL